jgi:hypothetical protein
LFGELVEMGPALEGPVAHEEVMLHVPDVPLILALGLRPGRSTGPRDEPIVAGQVDKAGMEADVPTAGMRQHRALLVIDQDLLGSAAEPLEGSDQPFIGVLGVLGVGAPEMEAARVAQGIHDDVDRRGLAGNHGALRRPIALKLPPGVCLKADRRPAGPQPALGVEIVTEDGDSPGVALRLELSPDHHGIPDALGQQLIDDRSVGIQQTPSPAAAMARRAATLERPPHRPRVHAELSSNVTEIDTSPHQCLNHHEVLRRQHVPLLPDGPSVEGHSRWWLGDFLFRCLSDFYHRR